MIGNKEGLRSLCRSRFLSDVVQAVTKSGKSSGLVLIMDDAASEILSSYLKLSELIANGVTVVENISRTRKPFSGMNAAYFMTPTRENIDIAQRDFSSSPQLYLKQHLFFLRRIPDPEFAHLSSLPFSKKLASLKELNLDFFPLSEVLFHLPIEGSVDRQVEGIASAIATVQEVSGIEVFRLNNPVFKTSELIQKGLDPRIRVLLPHLTPKGEGAQVKLFLFDRGFDLITPLLHDFHYESLLGDLLSSEVLMYGGRGQTLKSASPNSVRLEEDDPIFKKYRFEFIMSLLTGIPADFNQFLKENPAARMQKTGGDEMSLNKMQGVVQGIGVYKETVKQFTLHNGLIQKILAVVEQNDIKRIAETEQTVATGVKDDGGSSDSSGRLEAARKIVEQKSFKEELRLRIAMIAMGSLQKDASSLSTTLAADSKRVLLDFQTLVDNYGRFASDSTKDQYKKAVQKAFEEGESGLQRFITRAEYLINRAVVESVSSDFEVYRYEQPNSQSKKPTGFGATANTLFKAKNNAQKADAGSVVIIAYFAGGVSLSEIRALAHLERKSGGRFRVLIGSNRLLTPATFISEFVGSKSS